MINVLLKSGPKKGEAWYLRLARRKTLITDLNFLIDKLLFLVGIPLYSLCAVTSKFLSVLEY